MDYLIRRLGSEYPDIAIIQDIYREMVSKSKKEVGEGDNKYRPLTLVLAVLYRFQSREEGMIKEAGVDVDDGEEREQLLELLGYYWHLQHHLGKALREGLDKVVDKEKIKAIVQLNRLKITKHLGVEEDLVPLVSISELSRPEQTKADLVVKQFPGSTPKVEHHMDQHCPDFVLTIQPEHKAVVLTILGTRIFPRPHPQDLIMDLAARTSEFLGGFAHSGMAAGCRSLEREALPTILEQLRIRNGFSLLIVGYSLGAGLAQLFTRMVKWEKKLPDGVMVKAICYGCPPVFLCPDGSCAEEDVLAVSNHNDGVTGASLFAFNDLFLRTKALQQSNLKRRTMMKLAFKGGNDEEEIEDLADEDSEEDEEGDMEDEEGEKKEEVSSKPGFLRRATNTVKASSKRTVTGIIGTRMTNSEAWEKVEDVLSGLPPSHHPPLTLTAGRLLVIKKNEKEEEGSKIKMQSFTGPHETEHFSKQIRLKSKMFDSHMPWGYNALFADYGTSDKAKSISLKVLNKDNCQEEIDKNNEDEKTQTKEEKKTKDKEGEKTKGAKEERTEQVFEVKRSTGGLYPDLSLLTDG